MLLLFNKRHKLCIRLFALFITIYWHLCSHWFLTTWSRILISAFFSLDARFYIQVVRTWAKSFYGVPLPFSSLPRHILFCERFAYLKEGDSGKPLILKRIDPTGIRTCNLLICSQAPNPLGHRAISFLISIFYWLHLFVDSWRHFLTSVRPVPGPPLRLDGQLSIKNGSRFCYHLSIIVAMEMSHVF